MAKSYPKCCYCFSVVLFCASIAPARSFTADSTRILLGFAPVFYLENWNARITAPHYTNLNYTTLGLYPRAGLLLWGRWSVGSIGFVSWHWNSFKRLKPISGVGYYARGRLLTSRPRGRFGLITEVAQVFTTGYYTQNRNWEVQRIPLNGHTFWAALGAEIRFTKRFIFTPISGVGWDIKYKDDDTLRKQRTKSIYPLKGMTLHWKI